MGTVLYLILYWGSFITFIVCNNKMQNAFVEALSEKEKLFRYHLLDIEPPRKIRAMFRLKRMHWRAWRNAGIKSLIAWVVIAVALPISWIVKGV